MEQARALRSIRIWLSLFIIGLVLSGTTAFPLLHETDWFSALLTSHPFLPQPVILSGSTASAQPCWTQALVIRSWPTGLIGSPSRTWFLPSSSSALW